MYFVVDISGFVSPISTTPIHFYAGKSYNMPYVSHNSTDTRALLDYLLCALSIAVTNSLPWTEPDLYIVLGQSAFQPLEHIVCYPTLGCSIGAHVTSDEYNIGQGLAIELLAETFEIFQVTKCSKVRPL